MKTGVHRSFWLQEALKIHDAVCNPLTEEIKADVVIIGGGYVGLWTSLYIKRLEPACDVVVLEKDICGGGASGRNGGFALSWWPKISSLISLVGESEALRIAKDSEKAIGEIEKFSQEKAFDIHFRKKGWLWTATSNAQRGAWDSVFQAFDRLGVQVFKRLSPEEITKRTGSAAHREGVLDPTAATLHPGLLIRGMRRVALKQGIRIFEKTTVMDFSRRSPIKVETMHGRVITKKLVIANNAWAAAIPELARSIVPITSDMILTEPCEASLSRMGWTGGECITDSQTMVDYYHVTKDHRICFGKGGWGIAYGGNIGPDFDRNEMRAKTVEADFRRYYPSLNSIKITHDWCGPIDRTPNSLPLLGRFSKNENIIYGVGWSGNGVGPSVIGGKILASLALGRNDEWANYPLVGRSVGLFPPEPIRFLGAHLVRAAVAAKEKAEIVDQKPSKLSVWLSGFAPKGLEDKN